MVRIANLSYDTYFKYLMEDMRAARVLLSALLRREVVSLTQTKNEISAAERDRSDVKLSMLRLDFGAVIIDEKGEQRAVHIELQRTRGEGDVMRFRQYIGAHYQDMSLADENGRAIPIIEIYILGHNLPDVKIDDAVLYAKPRLTDVNDEPIPFEGSSEYIDGLTHSLIIVQLPKVKHTKKEGSVLNVLLSFFAYDDRSKAIDVPEAETYSLKESESLEVQLVQMRLVKAVGAQELNRDIDLELEVQKRVDQWYEERRMIERLARERAKAEEDKRKAEEEKAKAEEDKRRAEEDKRKAEQGKKRAEEEKKRAEEEKRKAEDEKKRAEEDKRRAEETMERMMKLLMDKGMTEEEVKRMMGK